MRLASLILSWIFWAIALLYWLFLTVVSFVPGLILRGNAKEPVDRLMLYAGLACIGFAFLLWFVRKKIWYDPRRAVGVGYLLYLFPLYAAVLFAVVGPYLDFFVWGATGLFFKVGFITTGILLACVYPSLPKTAKAGPDVVPND